MTKYSQIHPTMDQYVTCFKNAPITEIAVSNGKTFRPIATTGTVSEKLRGIMMILGTSFTLEECHWSCSTEEYKILTPEINGVRFRILIANDVPF